LQRLLFSAKLHPLPDLSRLNNMPDPNKWRTIDSAPENVVIWTRISDDYDERNVAKRVRIGRMWFHPDRKMYIYYTPTHWQEV
jgi:hypothetical protein